MRTILNLNQGWYFHKNTTVVPTRPADGELLVLPHTWNAKDGQDGGNDYFRGTCAYCKTLKKVDLPQGVKVFLEINGASSSADVFMNGKRLAHHDGGYSTWRVDLTAYLRDENTLTILVDNATNETVYPQTADFTFYGGLYRDVNLVCVPDTHFDLSYCDGKGLQVTPVMDGKDAKVSVQTWIEGRQPSDMLKLRILDAAGSTVAEQSISGDAATFTIVSAHLWDGMKDPYLYTLEASILRNDEVLDGVSARFGCRSFEIDPERGFILNGREYPLRGVSRHQDRWGIGNALLPEHHKEDMDLICEVGFNTIVNGESIGTKTAEDHFFRFDVYNSGETELLAVAGKCQDSAVIRKVASMNQDYILREQGAVLNWFDITEISASSSSFIRFSSISSWTLASMLGVHIGLSSFFFRTHGPVYVYYYTTNLVICQWFLVISLSIIEIIFSYAKSVSEFRIAQNLRFCYNRTRRKVYL